MPKSGQILWADVTIFEHQISVPVAVYPIVFERAHTIVGTGYARAVGMRHSEG